jgi:biopolymer transport protein ExbD
MNFRAGTRREEPEINLIPLIDVLLVILIFLMVTTTYSRYSELQINLPTAEASKPEEHPNQIDIVVGGDGKYAINQTAVAFQNAANFSDELKRAANGAPDPVIVINADAVSNWQSVVNVMQAAHLAGYSRITFTTQNTKQ